MKRLFWFNSLNQGVYASIWIFSAWLWTIPLAGCQPNIGSSKVGFFPNAQFLQGSLTKEDPISPKTETYEDTYTISVEGGQILIVGAESQSFDPFIEILDPNAKRIAQDDDSGPDVNAYLAIPVLESGSYGVKVSSFQAEEVGSYTLSYTVELPNWQQVLGGTLQEGDATHPHDQSLMDLYPLEAQIGQSLLVYLTSSEFDSYVEVVDPEGNVVVRNDDHPGSKDAMSIIFLEKTGSYQIRVNSFDQDGRGNYTLHYSLR
jgi:serine protease Do